MPIEDLVVGMMWLGIALYAVFGGADFGTGVWEFNTGLQASERDRDLMDHAIGPVWEANHVWLIFVIVAMFSAFPTAFAALSRALWVPLLCALVGIVFRGAAFSFRSHAVATARMRMGWSAVFGLASTAAPFFLGAAAGAVASGKLAVDADGRFTGDYVTGWVSILALFSGFFAVGLCAYLAGVFLTREAYQREDERLIQIWRRRATLAGICTGVLALAGIALVAFDSPFLWGRFRDRAWPLVGASIVTGSLSLWGVRRRMLRTAVAAAAATIVVVIIGWAVAQYPWIIPPAISVDSAKVSVPVLRLIAVSIALGMALIVPSLAYLFHVFKTSHD
jgi:cytochrome d ubiquinol oxidase subunit II